MARVYIGGYEVYRSHTWLSTKQSLHLSKPISLQQTLTGVAALEWQQQCPELSRSTLLKTVGGELFFTLLESSGSAHASPA